MLNYLNGVNNYSRNTKKQIAKKIEKEKLDKITSIIFNQAEIGAAKKKNPKLSKAQLQKINIAKAKAKNKSFLQQAIERAKAKGLTQTQTQLQNQNIPSVKPKRKRSGPPPKYKNPNPKSQVERANILSNAIDKANASNEISPLNIIRLKKQAVIDLNRKNFEEQGEPIVTEAPQEILESANEKFDAGLQEIQAPENLYIDEADSDEGGEDMGWIWEKGGLAKAQKDIAKAGQDAVATIKYHAKNAGAEFRKYNPVSVIARSSFLLLLKANVFNLRKKLTQGYNKNPKKIENWWVGTWGGDLNVLKNNLDLRGKPKKTKAQRQKEFAILLEKAKKRQKISGVAQIGSVGAALLTGTGVVLSVITILKELGIEVNKNENPEGDENYDDEDMGGIEENEDMGVYYPSELGADKTRKEQRQAKRAERKEKRQDRRAVRKGKRAERQTKRKDKRAKNKAEGNTFTDNFSNVADTSKQVLDATTETIRQGKAIYNEATGKFEQPNFQSQGSFNMPSNKNLMLLGAGAIALYFITKKK
jgi:hypothetical protein